MSLLKFKEFMDVFHPYLRWIMIATYALMFLYVNRMFMKDPILRKWLMSSMEERDGRSSGKSLTGFVFVKLVAFATLCAIIYSPSHLLPEYYLISLLTFIGSLYGVKVFSKYYDAKATNNTTTTTTSTQEVDASKTTTTESKEIKKNNPEDVG